MEFFRNARVVRLRSQNGKYLVAKDDEETVALGEGDPSSASDQWSVEFNSDSVLRLRSPYGKYLTSSDQPFLLGMTGCKVLQSLPLHFDSSHEWKPVMEGGHVKLRTHSGSFLRADGGIPPWRNSVTHALPRGTATQDWVLWDVDVFVREEEGSDSKTDDEESEDVIASKIVSAPKRRHETGEGSSVGFYGHRSKLKAFLLDDSRTKDVLISGGSGMMALVRQVCEDVRDHFPTIAWISLPQKNNSELICEEILVQLIYEKADFPGRFKRKTWMLRDHEFSLQETARCLIVVDDLEDTTLKKFEEVLRMVKKCRVIFIARGKKLSSQSQIHKYGREFETYRLENLSDVPRASKYIPDEDFPFPRKEVCQLIVEKCKRLPTAIVFILRDRKEWEARIPSGNVCHELHVIQQMLETIWEGLPKHQGHELDPIQQVLEILQKDDRVFCLLYLGIFPEDSPISCKRVCRLWVAEGLLENLAKAERFLDDLLAKKCILPEERKSDGEVSTFRMDERVREIIISLSNLRNLTTKTSQVSTNRPEGARYLSVDGAIRTLNEKKPAQLSSIFVLDVSFKEDKTTSEVSRLETSEDPLFPFNLKHSKVLDLKGAPSQIVPDDSFKLTNARYFSIRNTSIKKIPSSIRKLKHLEFLDAKHSLVTKLPQQVETLDKIRHILIYHHEKDPLMESYNLIGFKASCRLEKLVCLEKLCFLEVDEKTSKDLGNLTKLRRLGITNLREEHGKFLCTSLKKLKELQSLNIHAFEEDEILDLHHAFKEDETLDLHPLLSLPGNLKRLYLHGRLKKLPAWISSLNDLTKIILRWSQLKEDLLATLGKLPHLLELELRRAYDGNQLNFKNGQFRKLRILLLDELEGLRSMNLEKGTMSNLENLTISRCQWLEGIPSDIQHIRTIRKLTFFDMSHEFYDKVGIELKKDRYEKFENKQEVHFTRWRAGHWEIHQIKEADAPNGWKALMESVVGCIS